MDYSLPILGKEYSSALRIFDILEKIYSLFTDPISDSAFGLWNSRAARLYREDRESFNAIAKEWIKRYACQIKRCLIINVWIIWIKLLD